MVYDQKGARIKTLQKILNAIADIYNLARDRGIMTVRFLNATKGKKNVTAQTVKTVIKGHDYGGVTRIGTELKKKILDKFVLGIEMKKPLLIMVITDGAVRDTPPFLSPYIWIRVESLIFSRPREKARTFWNL